MAGLSDRVGAVVLAYGDDSDLHRDLVEDLHAAGFASDAITVVHNPTDTLRGRVPVVPGCRLIVSPRNVGYAGGMNLGLADRLRAGDAAVVLLTHEIRLPPGVVSGLVAGLEGGAAIAGPPLLDGDETTWGGVLNRLGRAFPSSTRPDLPADVAWVNGCCLAMRVDRPVADLWLDERFFMYFEEVDLCARTRAAGGRVEVVDVDAVRQTPGGPRRGQVYTYLLARNDVLFRSKHHGWRGAWHAARYRLAVTRQQHLTATRAGHAPAMGATVLGVLHAVLGRFGSPPRSVQR